MKKINFSKHILPHIIAIAAFLLVTVFFFNPVFFENKIISQHDIEMWDGSSKALRDFRDKTGEEGLWASTMFSGMPSYMINTQWSNGPVILFKKILSVGLPHPVNNILIAFICYYILLLSFSVRPYLAIAGAIAFGLSSYMIIGLGAGHNGRIGAIALMPLIMAGIHLVFSGKKILGFGVTTLGLGLHLRENHIQITYYLLLIVLVYGLVQLIDALLKKRMPDFFKTLAILIPTILIAGGTYFGQFWALTEYSRFSMRGPSELKSTITSKPSESGLSKSYAFQYSNEIGGEMTLIIPDFYGGNGTISLLSDPKSQTYQTLAPLAQSGDQEKSKLANELAGYASGYWGSRPPAPYYAGAIICFLFILGIVYADRKYSYWLVPLSIVSIMLAWGDSFPSFNYFMFDYFPVYNKFRSVTFTLIIILFAMPLLGFIGLENLLRQGWNKQTVKKLAWPVGICLLLCLSGTFASLLKDSEQTLPEWFKEALQADRATLLRSDAWRAFWFIAIFAALLFARLKNWIKDPVFALAAFLLITFDLALVDKRYFDKTKFIRKGAPLALTATLADIELQKDKSYYRVFKLNPQDPSEAWRDASTSYFHNSIGGYHGAKLRRYEDLYDSCIYRESIEFLQDAQRGQPNFTSYGILNMLNVKYIVYGPGKDNIIPNPAANGSAWFVKEALSVNSPSEELEMVCSVNTKQNAVIDISAFKLPEIQYDSASSLQIIQHDPNYLKYESQSQGQGLAIFSEIYYPKGWKAAIDGKNVDILRANYVLRAVVIPPGKHSIEFKFEPDAYFVGNKVTLAMSWLLLLVVLGSLGWSLREEVKGND